MKLSRFWGSVQQASHQAVGTIAGCGVNALSGLRRVREFVGLIRRAS
ncbi:hypothetical protein P9439_23025, partial [Escherichia coli]